MAPWIFLLRICLADLACPAGRTCGSIDAGSQCRENGFHLRKGIGLAADHQVVPTIQATHAATGPAVQQPDAAFRQPFGVPHVIAVVGVSAVDDGVTGFQRAGQFAVGDVAATPGTSV